MVRNRWLRGQLASEGVHSTRSCQILMNYSSSFLSTNFIANLMFFGNSQCRGINLEAFEPRATDLGLDNVGFGLDFLILLVGSKSIVISGIFNHS